MDYTSFNHLIEEQRIAERISFDQGGVLVAPDSSFLRRMPYGFFSEHRKYELCVVSGVARESRRFVNGEHYKRSRLIDRQKIVNDFLNSTKEIQVEPTLSQEMVISFTALEAAEELKKIVEKKNNRSLYKTLSGGDIGIVDMQQIALAWQRGERGLGTILLTYDAGIKLIAEKLRTDKSFSEIFRGKTEVWMGNRDLDKKYSLAA